MRKPKRVSDVNAIGQTAPMPAPYMQPAFQEPLQPQQPPQQFNGNPNYGYPGGFPAQQNGIFTNLAQLGNPLTYLLL